MSKFTTPTAGGSFIIFDQPYQQSFGEVLFDKRKLMNFWIFGSNRSGYQSIPSVEEEGAPSDRTGFTGDKKRGLVIAGWVSVALLLLVITFVSVNKHVTDSSIDRLRSATSDLSEPSLQPIDTSDLGTESSGVESISRPYKPSFKATDYPKRESEKEREERHRKEKEQERKEAQREEDRLEHEKELKKEKEREKEREKKNEREQKELDDAAKKAAEEEAQRRAEAAEAVKKAVEDAAKKAVEEASKKEAEAIKAAKAAKEALEEAAKKAAEEAAKKVAEATEAAKRAAEDAVKKGG